LPYSLVKRAAGENRWFLPHGKVNGYIKKYPSIHETVSLKEELKKKSVSFPPKNMSSH